MIKINVILKNSRWKKYLNNPSSYIDGKIKKINKIEKKYKKKKLYCSLMLSGNNEIKNLNRKFRNKNKITDVLSFPFYKKDELKKKLKKEKEIYLGDIIININKIKIKNKDIFKLKFNKLWIHGFVHLFGFEHKKEKDYNKMIKIEKKYLSYLY